MTDTDPTLTAEELATLRRAVDDEHAAMTGVSVVPIDGGRVLDAVRRRIVADALLAYADRHHAHYAGPDELVREQWDVAGQRYLACRACGTRLDEAGACAGERPRLLRAADRIARGGPDPADPPRPGTEYVPETIVREVDRG